MTLSEKFAATAVSTVLFKILTAGLVVKWGSDSITMGTIDAGTVAALLTPVLAGLHAGAYIANKKGTSSDEDNKT